MIKDAAPSDLHEMTKALRARSGLSVPDFAASRGVAASNVYWAEGSDPDRTISVDAIRKIYHDICEDDDEYAQLLILYIINKDGNKVSIGNANQALKRVASTKTAAQAKTLKELGAATGHLTKSQKQLVISLAEIIPGNPATEKMLNLIVETSTT